MSINSKENSSLGTRNITEKVFLFETNLVRINIKFFKINFIKFCSMKLVVESNNEGKSF